MVSLGFMAFLMVIFICAIRFTPLCLFRRFKKYSERPACMNDPQLGIHGQIKTADGSLHYVASGPRDKPLMLFIHGFPENWHSWRHQILEFQNEYRVVAIDSRGAGESEKVPSVSNYTVDKLALDVKSVLTQLGHSSCVLVGHDWGGVIALYFAGTYPDLVDKLIILNAADIAQMQTALYSDLKQMFMSWYMFAYQIPWIPEYTVGLNFNFLKDMYGEGNKNVTDGDVEAVKFGLCQPGTLTSTINYYRANVASPMASYQRNAILCPTLLIWGTGDEYLGMGLTKGHEKYVQDLTVSYIEGANHFPHQHKPEEVNKAMRMFLQGDGSEEVVDIIS